MATCMKPKEMEEAIIKNLIEKTGRSLKEWFLVLEECGLSEKGDLKEHLKNIHSVGHFQAQTIVKFYNMKN